MKKKEYWSGLPGPPSGDLPNPAVKPLSLMSPALAGRFITTRATWEAQVSYREPCKREPSLLSSGVMKNMYSMACSMLGSLYILCLLRQRDQVICSRSRSSSGTESRLKMLPRVCSKSHQHLLFKNFLLWKISNICKCGKTSIINSIYLSPTFNCGRQQTTSLVSSTHTHLTMHTILKHTLF